MQLEFCVAVAVVLASGYSSDWTPSLGTSMCRGYGLRKDKEKNKKERKNEKDKYHMISLIYEI